MIVKSITIGTADDCDLRVTDEYASKVHCQIDQYDNGIFMITDMSMNGTWVTRRGWPAPFKLPLGSRSPLCVGDVIRVGRTEIPWKQA